MCKRHRAPLLTLRTSHRSRLTPNPLRITAPLMGSGLVGAGRGRMDSDHPQSTQNHRPIDGEWASRSREGPNGLRSPALLRTTAPLMGSGLVGAERGRMDSDHPQSSQSHRPVDGEWASSSREGPNGPWSPPVLSESLPH